MNTSQIPEEAQAAEYSQDCPKCGLTIPTPTFLTQESLGYNPELMSFGIRIHIMPNDVEYQTHVIACG